MRDDLRRQRLKGAESCPPADERPSPHGRAVLRGLLSAVVIAFLALAVPGCAGGSEKRAFQVPPDLCGIPVAPSALEPVLPGSGSTLEATSRSRAVGSTNCTVTVDKQSVLAAISEWQWDASVREVAGSNPYLKLDQHISADGTYAYSEQGGASLVSCPVAAKEHPGAQLYVRILIYEAGTHDEAGAKRLLQTYATAVAGSPQCTGAGQ
ncbi:hypothetical protein [Streptomyces sp. NPDC015131]|uniref:hypothetical protein n=1 Tax=Streptomyces sp. NPDC015131 TaxID=3364941 RepID=UPI003703304B